MARNDGLAEPSASGPAEQHRLGVATLTASPKRGNALGPVDDSMSTALAQPLPEPISSRPTSRAANGTSAPAQPVARPTQISSPCGEDRCGGIPSCSALSSSTCGPPGDEPIIASRRGAILPNGTRYPGALVADILEYRLLRAATLRGGTAASAEALARCDALEARLRSLEEGPNDAGHVRAFHRFDFALPVYLIVTTQGTARVVPAQLENISAGGVKLRSSLRPLQGQEVALLVEHPDGSRARLPARVVWRGSEDALGLMFAGAPAWGESP